MRPVFHAEGVFQLDLKIFYCFSPEDPNSNSPGYIPIKHTDGRPALVQHCVQLQLVLMHICFSKLRWPSPVFLVLLRHDDIQS